MPRKKKGVVNVHSFNNVDTVVDLLALADKHIDEFEYDTALGFCERALRVDENNVRALETCSSVLLEVGKFKKAKTLEKAVRLSPDLGHSKMLSLAQLCEGKEAVKLFNKGIELLKQELQFLESAISSENNEVTSKKASTLRKKLSNAFCSIVEIFMTDLCDEEDAEQQCHANIEQAISADETNPEAYQCKASLLMVRENIEEAKKLMTKSLSLWMPKMKELVEKDSTEEYPLSFETRLNCAKVLIELKMFESADDVLLDLMSEDDKCIELWYLTGVLHYLNEADEDAMKEAKFYLLAARELFDKYGVGDNGDMKAHVDELLDELKDVPEAGAEYDDDEQDNNDDWEDIDSELEVEEEMES